ncbi:MAG TPA: protein kinase family protein [Bacillales bacterium]|nr:protein kinase family protein [Bacillales bacterium]
MMNHSLKSQCKVSPGTVIKGKWHGNQYSVLKELGNGANGVVYLAKNKTGHVALKMSNNGMSVTSEVNVLKSFAKVQGSALGPCLLDFDDWQTNQGNISFYVMEYIHGPDLLTFIQQNGESWTIVLFLQLLNDLEKFHENGWVFGDLKPENLIVTGPPVKIRCIDVGGTTIQGRAIKEFTEFYDRGFWGLGTRKAEPSYDLFAAGMIMINTAYPKRFNKTSGGILQLKEAIGQKKELILLEKVILKSLQGHYGSAKEMRLDLLSLAVKKNQPTQSVTQNRLTQTKSPPAQKKLQTRQSYKKKKKKSGWIETAIIFMVIVLFYIMYILSQFT